MREVLSDYFVSVFTVEDTYEIHYQISKLLAILFNKFLNSGRVPDIWKLVNVTKKKEINHYRLTTN